MTILTVTLITLGALAASLLALFGRATWQPRLTPGIAADLTIVLAEDGQIAIFNSKLSPEQHPGDVYGRMLSRWLDVLSALGVSLNWQTPTGQIVPLCRPYRGEALPGPEDEVQA